MNPKYGKTTDDAYNYAIDRLSEERTMLRAMKIAEEYT